MLRGGTNRVGARSFGHNSKARPHLIRSISGRFRAWNKSLNNNCLDNYSEPGYSRSHADDRERDTLEAALRFAATGSVPQPVADVRSLARAGRRAVRPL